MARKIIDIGAVGNDGTGDSIRDSFRKVNDNFRELYSSLGLGEKLTFIGLDDVPSSYIGQNDPVTGNTPLVTVNNTESGLSFKRLVEGNGISIDFTTNPNEISINSDFAEISADSSPQLGGNLSLRSGANQYRVIDAGTTESPLQPIFKHELVNKAYADSKISRAGVNAIDPETGNVNAALGRMSGPLILARDPEPDDDETYGGLIAATKRYVDNASFGSVANLYVATSGQDDRPGVSSALQGRALAYAYRTFEAALKRAEELVLESRQELGPYQKVLTFNNGTEICTLSSITTAPSSGSGFIGSVRLSVDSAIQTELGVGTNYYAGDILTLNGGIVAAGGAPCRIEVLSTLTTPGAISSFRIVSTGVYTTLPTAGVNGVSTTITTSAAPVGVGAVGAGASFVVTYNVNSITINNGGSGYSLVSVRIIGGGGSGAFGNATVAGGSITGITITDRGSGFTAVPTIVADLPRFSIRTDGLRTDFTGDVLTSTPTAFRGRDIREGLFLRGENSRALAQILSHSGELDSSGNEIFDVDNKFGSFQIGEPIAYGDVSRSIQITILVESGIYEENLPLRIPQNVAIVGDEFRRCIVRPRTGTSSSPWAFLNFRRDTEQDGLTTATQLYGYHYLQDSTNPVYPKIDNKGDYRAAAQLLVLNRSFIAEEIIAWINFEIADGDNTDAFPSSFEYNENLCKRDIGLIIDSLVFDLKYGGYARTISAALKYYQSASALVAITTQLSQYLAVINKLNTVLQFVITNTAVSPVYQTLYTQIIDNAFSAEIGSNTVITDLLNTFTDVIDGSGSVNYPKDNNEMDVFLCNDAVILRAITGQGHGGFMMVLDPEGQILAKSPYAQECASFSKSQDKQVFAGGIFVDGFTGNLQFRHSASASPTAISITDIERFPQLPASFIVNDQVYRVNYVRDYVYSPSGSTANFVLDETTPFTNTPGAQTCTISIGSPAVITRAEHRLQPNSFVRFTTTGSLPTGIVAGQEYYVLPDGLTTNTFRITANFGSNIPVNTSGSQSGTQSFQRIYELLMPGNRSMLSNDFTQVNDLGYGIFATNGGLTEAVSMFTYYCHISYYSLNGAQIRSVGGSSAHGNFALIAEGSDPLEIPTPTTVFQDLSQRVICYFPTPTYENTTGGLFIFVTGYDFPPLNNSELEIDHGSVLFRYPVTSVTTEGLPPGVARLNLTSDTTGNFDGLFASVVDGTKMTLKMGSQVLLTGDLGDVATRPSTGLRLAESQLDVYRVLQFEDYVDPNGPYEVEIDTGTPGRIRVLETIIEIDTNVCTTVKNHNLRNGDKFIPTSTANGFTSGTIYYIISVPNYNEFTVSTSPSGSVETLSNGTGLTIKGVKGHKLLADYRISFAAGGGTLPVPLVAASVYYVSEVNLTDIEFEVSELLGGGSLAITTTGSGTFTYSNEGITKTTLRENYNYVNLTVSQPGELVSGTTAVTISIASPGLFTTSGSHGLNAGDVIRLIVVSGTLPVPLSDLIHYHVLAGGLTATEFTISSTPGGTAIDTSGSASGSYTFGKVTGRAGDQNFAVVALSPADTVRADGTKFVFKGEEYIIVDYENETDTGQPYGRVNLDRPLVDSIISFVGAYTISAAVPIRSIGASGNLTIRISLTRVTSHDLLEIGTGSYADTNYPNEIYGPPVNALDESKETEERTVGRVFYVTTDQFGNFSVGPYFKVDQGTGRVTFSAAIALSNLDGIGFKRGVPIAEFSTDSSFSDNAVDTVPTENATRVYIERRLGIGHNGNTIESSQLIPVAIGGFMSLDGQLAMKANMSLGNFKVTNAGDPTNPTDLVNLRSLTFSNLQEFTITNPKSADILTFTGAGDFAQNSTVIGDISLNIDSTANTVDAQINPGVILDADVNATADIIQSKLLLTLATTLAAAPTGTAAAKQAASGVASFDSAQFTATDGWLTVKDNGLVITKIAQIATKTVLGNSSLSTGNLSEVPFTTVVNDCGAVKKSQYNAVGFLRRTSASSFSTDGDYSVVEAAVGTAAAPEVSKLIIRDSNGDFGARIADFSRVKIDNQIALDSEPTVTGGYIRIYGYNTAGGILISDGSLAANKITAHWNDAHEFRTQNGVSLAPITASSIQVTALTTGGNTTAGTITGRWTLTGTSPNESRLQATYSADLAEYYEGDQEYEVGTVLVFGGDKEVTVTDTKNDTRVAGVVSNTAAFAMYEGCPGLKNLVALQGRVPCKVVGKIKKGDILITSGIPGVAVAAIGDVKVGTVVGKALVNYDSDHIGKIEIAVGRT